MRENPRTVRETNRQSGRLRAAAVLGCAALVVTVAVVTSLLIREPDPAPIRAIELSAQTPTPRPSRGPTAKPKRHKAKRKRPAVAPTPARTAAPTRTAAPGGFAPPTADDDPEDDPFDDEPGEDADDDGD